MSGRGVRQATHSFGEGTIYEWDLGTGWMVDVLIVVN